MAYIQLHPKDAERFGVEARIEFDLGAVGVRQRSAFEKAVKRPIHWMLDQLQGVPELDEHGNATPEPVLDDDGQPVLDDAGQPLVEPRLTTDPEAYVMLVWLVLWGAGVRVPWDDFDVRELGTKISFASDGEQGKAEDPERPTDSESSTTDQ